MIFSSFNPSGAVCSVACNAHRDAHAAADAQGGESLLGIAFLHFMQKRQAPARRSPRPDGRSRWRPTFEVSQPRSLLTAQAWAAKASLASIRSSGCRTRPCGDSDYRSGTGCAQSPHSNAALSEAGGFRARLEGSLARWQLAENQPPPP